MQFESKSFRLARWKAPEWDARADLNSVKFVRGTFLDLHMEPQGDQDMEARVICEIVGTGDPTLKFSVVLTRKKNWFVTGVVQRTDRSNEWVFTSASRTDGCSVGLPDGKELSVGLRYLPCAKQVSRQKSGIGLDKDKHYRILVFVGLES